MESQISNLQNEIVEFKRFSDNEKKIFKAKEEQYISEIERFNYEMKQNEALYFSRVRYLFLQEKLKFLFNPTDFN